MKVKIILGTKINKITREIGAIKRMNQKGLIWTPTAKILRSWKITEYVKFPYYRISKWNKPRQLSGLEHHATDVRVKGSNPLRGSMKTKIVEAETIVVVEYPYVLGNQIGIQDIIFKKYFMDYKENQEMTLLYKLVDFEQRNDW